MSQHFRIDRLIPEIVVPGGEIVVEFTATNINVDPSMSFVVAGNICRTIAISSNRLIAVLPDDVSGGVVECRLETRGTVSESSAINVGDPIADMMHMVASPAVDPNDDSIMLMRSGGRGQNVGKTLFRYSRDVGVYPLEGSVMNPSGFAFSPRGELFVTDRFNGDVYSVSSSGVCSIFASGLGIATGIAFDADGAMYVGDRSGKIYRVRSFTETEPFARLEQSVAAYHLAFGPDGRLYVTAPGLSSHDSVHAIDRYGNVDKFFTGLGRPQGMAFSESGDLYVAACYRGRRGVVRIAADCSDAEHFVAGDRIVGLCFTRGGQMIIASNDSVFAIDCGIKGTLL